MTDNDFLLSVLSDGEWHNLDEILDRSYRERGCRLTVHSRASNLRHLGYVVENETRRGSNSRIQSFYRLVLNEAAEPTPTALLPDRATAPAASLSTPVRPVPVRPAPQGSNTRFLLEFLADGEWHTEEEILDARGHSFQLRDGGVLTLFGGEAA